MNIETLYSHAKELFDRAHEDVRAAEQDVQNAEQHVQNAEEKLDNAKNKYRKGLSSAKDASPNKQQVIKLLKIEVALMEKRLTEKVKDLGKKRIRLKKKEEDLAERRVDLKKKEEILFQQRTAAMSARVNSVVEASPSGKEQRPSAPKGKLTEVITDFIQKSRIKINLCANSTACDLESQLVEFSTDEEVKQFIAEYNAAGDIEKANKWADTFKKYLLNERESKCQDKLSKNAAKLHAVDTSSKTNYRFMHAIKSNDNTEVRYNISAKPDLTFTHSCGAHEIKTTEGSESSSSMIISDYELLTQMLYRVYTIRNCHAFYNTAWVTGCTARTAWFVIFQRDISQYGTEEYERIDVLRIEHNMIYKIWKAYEAKATKNEYWYYTDHAPYILKSINCFCDPYLVITRLAAKSMSYVYTISLPRFGDNNFYAIPVPDFALKVVTDEVTYVTEKKALSKIVPKYNDMCDNDEVHYALGFYDELKSPDDAAENRNKREVTGGLRAADTSRNMKNELKALLEALEVTSVNDNAAKNTRKDLLEALEVTNVNDNAAKNTRSDYCSDQLQRIENFQFKIDQREFVCIRCDGSTDRSSLDMYQMRDKLIGGVIFMKYGIPIDHMEEDVVDGVLKSLRVAHSEEWCHTDIRLSNCMRFGEHVQLIDYGFACKVKDRVVFVEGSRYDIRGSRLKNCAIGTNKCLWETGDDYEMLIKYLMKRKNKA